MDMRTASNMQLFCWHLLLALSTGLIVMLLNEMRESRHTRIGLCWLSFRLVVSLKTATVSKPFDMTKQNAVHLMNSLHRHFAVMLITLTKF